MKQHLVPFLALCIALASGCALFGNKSAAAPVAAGDPTCVADGSFEADFHGCTGKPGATAAAPQPSAPPTEVAE